MKYPHNRQRLLELAGVTEAGPSQQQIKQSQQNTKLFKTAEKAYADLLKFLKKWDREVGGGDPTRKQYSAAETAMQNALKDIKPFWDSDSSAIMTNGTAAQKLYKQTKSTIDGLKFMLYGD